MKEQNIINSPNEILVLSNFSGSYLSEGENIGHEIINFFRADDKMNYIFATPNGWIGKEHNNKIKAIILGYYDKGQRAFEILAKAENPEQLVFVKSVSPKKFLPYKKNNKIIVPTKYDILQQYPALKKLCEIQDNLLKKVRYGEKDLREVFKNNVISKNADPNPIYFTFKCKNSDFKKVTTGKKIYLIDDNSDIEGSENIITIRIDNLSRVRNESGRGYFVDGEN